MNGEMRVPNINPLVDYKVVVHGSYQNSLPSDKEFIQTVVASFRHRDGKKHRDGSLGTVEITPGELRDLLAYIMEDNN